MQNSEQISRSDTTNAVHQVAVLTVARAVRSRRDAATAQAVRKLTLARKAQLMAEMDARSLVKRKRKEIYDIETTNRI